MELLQAAHQSISLGHTADNMSCDMMYRNVIAGVLWTQHLREQGTRARNASSAYFPCTFSEHHVCAPSARIFRKLARCMHTSQGLCFCGLGIQCTHRTLAQVC